MGKNFGPGIMGGVVLVDPATGQPYKASDITAGDLVDPLTSSGAALKAAYVAVTASQGLDSTKQGNARANLGLGTSATKKASTVIDVLDPPTGLTAAVFNGTADDTAPLQAMLDSIATGGGTLRLPSGKTAKCNLVITGKGGIEIIGGGASTVLSPYDLTKPVLKVGDGTIDTKHIQLTSFNVIGDTTTSTSDGIIVNGAQNCTFRNMRVTLFGGYGVKFTSSATRATQLNTLHHFYVDLCRASAMDLDYGASWMTSLYGFGLFLTGNVTAGNKVLTMGPSTALYVEGGYITAMGSELGHVEMATTATIIGHGLSFDSPLSTDTIIVATGTKTLVTSFLRGNMSVDGYIKYATDGTFVTRTYAGGSIGARLTQPTVYEMVLADTSAAIQTLEDSNKSTGYVLTNVNSHLALYPTGISGGDLQYIFHGKAGTPASAAAAGVTGSMLWDATYVYFCIATNSWVRVARGATW